MNYVNVNVMTLEAKLIGANNRDIKEEAFQTEQQLSSTAYRRHLAESGLTSVLGY